MDIPALTARQILDGMGTMDVEEVQTHLERLTEAHARAAAAKDEGTADILRAAMQDVRAEVRKRIAPKMVKAAKPVVAAPEPSPEPDCEDLQDATEPEDAPPLPESLPKPARKPRA